MASKWRKKSGGEAFDPLKLHKARNEEKVMDYLKREGCDPYRRDDKGDLPIHAYVRRTDPQRLGCLFAFLIYSDDYDIDAINKEADTPLHLACMVKSLNCVKVLVAFDADVNIFNGSKLTPLDLAEGCEEIATLLVDVGGLTSRSIMDPEYEAQDFPHQMDRDVMQMNISEMSCSMGGARGARIGGLRDSRLTGNGGRDGTGKGGVSADDLTIKLQGVKNTGLSEIGYQRKPELTGNDMDESIYYSPPERQMDSIPEGSDEEEFETPNPSFNMPITEQVGINRTDAATASPQDDHTERILRENLFPLRTDRSPSPVRSSSPRCYSPSRPSTLLQSNQSPTRSPASNRVTPAHPLPSKASPSFRSPVSRSPPPETYHYSKNSSASKTPPSSKTPPPSRSPIMEYSRSPTLEKASGPKFSTPLSEGDKEKQKNEEMSKNYKMLMEEKSQEEEDDDDDDDDNFYKRLVHTMFSGLSKMDFESRSKMEREMEKNLSGEDYMEWKNFKGKKRQSQPQPPPQPHQIPRHREGREKPKEDALLAPAIRTTSPPNEPPPLRSAMKPHPSGRRHTDGLLEEKRRVQFLSQPPKVGESLRGFRLRGSLAALENSLSMSRSLFNPNMSVTESGLGTSVRPGQIKMHKKGQRGHRILCLDGGGIKGVVELEILRALERLSNSRIPDLFDWIVGTSIGGIFTLGMVYGNKTISDLFKICFRMKDSVMKKKSWLKYSCDTDALEKLLKDLFGEETKLSQKKKTKVMITTVKKSDSSLPLVFLNNCFKDKSDELVWKVARHTSAAPGFFKSSDGYIDGGMVANNPSNHGLTKIKMFLKQTKEEQKKNGEKMCINTDIACLLSVGCGNYPPKEIGNCDIDNLLDMKHLHQAPERIKNAVQTLLACIGRSEDDALICRIFCEEMQIPYYRLSPKVEVEVGTAETDSLKICDCIISAKKLVQRDEAHLEELVRNLGKEPLQQTRINTFV